MSKIKDNILILAPFYNRFIKEVVDSTSKYVGNIHVFVYYNPILEVIKYIPLGGYFDYIRLYTKNMRINLDKKPKNVNIYPISLFYLTPDGKNKFLGDRIFKKVDRIIQKKGIEFNLIHAHFTWPSGYSAIKLGKNYKKPVIITIHEDRELLFREYKSKNKKIYWSWKSADVLIRVNKKDISILQKFNKNVIYIPNGFNPKKLFVMDQYKARQVLGLPCDIKIIFTFGNLVERKGFQYLINSMTEILKVRKDVLCFIGGTGPMKQKLKMTIQKFGLEDHIKLIGFIPDEVIPYWLNAADVFVLPSLSEGNPTVMFEALGVGLPIVGTKVGGVPEIITSENYGLLCKPADPKDLAEKILIALDIEWDREKIRKYAEQFTWENIAKRIVEVYYMLINKSSP